MCISTKFALNKAMKSARRWYAVSLYVYLKVLAQVKISNIMDYKTCFYFSISRLTAPAYKTTMNSASSKLQRGHEDEVPILRRKHQSRLKVLFWLMQTLRHAENKTCMFSSVGDKFDKLISLSGPSRLLVYLSCFSGRGFWTLAISDFTCQSVSKLSYWPVRSNISH